MCILLILACSLQAVEMRKGPYLFYPGENTKMAVLWQLYETQSCTLQWGQDPEYLTESQDTVEYGDDHQHKYTISGLRPGRKYYYQVTAGDDVYLGSFLSAPRDNAKSLKFLAHGDTRSYPEDHDRVDAGMIDAFEADPDYQTLTLLTGDWVGQGFLEEDWDEHFFGFGGLYTNSIYLQGNLPINGCIGNHESSGPTLYPKYWPYPYVDGYYWSFEYGPALFIVIDQDDVRINRNSPQLAWVENELATTDKKWKFLQFHEPGYSAGGHEDDPVIQKMIQPLCEEYGVDMVFAGHNHYYARCEVNGVQHITAGGGGAPLRSDPDLDYSEYVVTGKKAHHFCQVEIDDDMLYFKVWDVNEVLPYEERLIDELTIEH